MPPVVTEAICLTVQKYSETSKIAVLYTQRWGRLSVIAKGVNRPKSQFLGHLEALSIAECVIYHKPRERLQLLTSCRSVVPWLGLTASLSRAGHAYAIAEFLYRHTHEEADDQIYGLARETLITLGTLPESQLARQFWGFMAAVLDTMGFRPELDVCERCGKRPSDDQRVVFDAVAGKIICRDCRADRNEQGHAHVLPVAALAELRQRLLQPILTGAETPLGNGTLDEAATALEDFARYHLGGGPLRSLELARRGQSS